MCVINIEKTQVIFCSKKKNNGGFGGEMERAERRASQQCARRARERAKVERKYRGGDRGINGLRSDALGIRYSSGARKWTFCTPLWVALLNSLID